MRIPEQLVTTPELRELVNLALSTPTEATRRDFYGLVQRNGETPEKHAVVAALLEGPTSPRTQSLVQASAQPHLLNSVLPQQARRISVNEREALAHLLTCAGPLRDAELARAIRARARAALPELPVTARPPIASCGVRIPLSMDRGPGVQRQVHIDRDMGTYWVVEQKLVRRGRMWMPDPTTETWRGAGQLDIPSAVLWGSVPFER